MKTAQRLIVALDGMTLDVAMATIKLLAPLEVMFKLGIEQINAQAAGQLARLAFDLGSRLFWDGKFHDIPTTVAKAVNAALTNPGVRIINVHCLGGEEMMRAAVGGLGDRAPVIRPILVGVTILTSHDYRSALRLGLIQPCVSILVPDGHGGKRPANEREVIAMKVEQLADMAQECGLDGVIASPLELASIIKRCGSDFKVITPGVRPAWAATDDQKRIMTPGEAIKAGAYALVVGRPITKPPTEIGGPLEAAKLILEEIRLAEIKSSIPEGQASPL